MSGSVWEELIVNDAKRIKELKKQGALEELKKALLLSTALNDKDIESYLNHRIKELEGCEKNVIVK